MGQIQIEQEFLCGEYEVFSYFGMILVNVPAVTYGIIIKKYFRGKHFCIYDWFCV